MNFARVFGFLALRLGWLLVGASCALACSRRKTSAVGEPDAPCEARPLRYQGWSSTVTFIELADDLGYLAPLRLEWVGNTISGPQDIQTVVTGDIDLGVAFNGAIVKLVAAGAPIRAVVASAGVDANNFGGFYVTEDSSIRTARDLIGKTIGVNTLGAHTEFVLREYLARNGLTREEAKQVTMVVVPPINSELTLRKGQIDVATLSGIHRHKAVERGGVRALFSDYDLFGTFTSASIVFTERFIRSCPDTVRRFVDATARAIEWARLTPRDKVQERFRDIIRRRARNEDAALVRYWHSVGVPREGGIMAAEDFDIWVDWLLRQGELARNELDVSRLYTNAFNPYRPRDP